MEKCINISSCMVCPFKFKFPLQTEGNKLICEHKECFGKEIILWPKIPEWCPLMDAPRNNENNPKKDEKSVDK